MRTRSSDRVRTRSSDKNTKAASRPRTTSREHKAASDRRVDARHALEVPIEMTVGREMLIYATTNLSIHGAFFQRAIPYPVGTHVALRIHLPGERQPILCTGEIVNVPNKKDLGMGLKFVDISDADQKRIEQLAHLGSASP